MSFLIAAATSFGFDPCVDRVANRITSALCTGRPHDRAASLKTRLHLLRKTAFPSRFGATKATRPRSPESPRRTVARTSGWLYLLPPLKTRSNSLLDLMVSIEVGLVRDGQTLATLCATACQYLAAALRGHTCAKTVGLCALPLVWLIRAFHGSSCRLWSGVVP